MTKQTRVLLLITTSKYFDPLYAIGSRPVNWRKINLPCLLPPLTVLPTSHAHGRASGAPRVKIQMSAPQMFNVDVVPKGVSTFHCVMSNAGHENFLAAQEIVKSNTVELPSWASQQATTLTTPFIEAGIRPFLFWRRAPMNIFTEQRIQKQPRQITSPKIRSPTVSKLRTPPAVSSCNGSCSFVTAYQMLVSWTHQMYLRSRNEHHRQMFAVLFSCCEQ